VKERLYTEGRAVCVCVYVCVCVCVLWIGLWNWVVEGAAWAAQMCN